MEICREFIDHPSAWKASDFSSADDFAFDLNERHYAAFDAALANVRKQGLTLDDVEREQFQIPEIADDIAGLFDEIQKGRGFVLIRGFPLDRYSEEEIGLIYVAIGSYMGTGVSQSGMAEKLGHVMDHSRNDPNARAYRNKQDLSLHTDLSEIVSLLSLATAKTGGLSQFASAVTIHNEILRSHPEYLEPLYEGFRYYRAGEEGPGEDPVTPWKVPVLAYSEGLVSARYVRSYLENGAEVAGEPLTELQRRALDFFDETAKRQDIMLEFLIEPGQAVFQNNYVVLHARSAFEDEIETGHRRHLLRLWLDVPNGRPAPKEMHLHSEPGIMQQADKRPSGEGEAYKALLQQQ